MGKPVGAEKDYKFGQKNNWRRTLWNEVLKRTGGREKYDYVLYLAGPQDIDRQVAREAGIPDWNLVAVDRSVGNVQRLRSREHISVDLELHDVLASWGQGRPVCAVVADLCCGLSAKALEFHLATYLPEFHGTVFAFNFMRGRERGFESIVGPLKFSGLLQTMPYRHAVNAHLEDREKHRGFIFLMHHLWDLFARMCEAAQVPISKHLTQDDFLQLFRGCGYLYEVHDPAFLSYRSEPFVFDSVVFKNADWDFCTNFIEDLVPEMTTFYEQTFQQKQSWFRSTYRTPHAVRKIGAMFAIAKRRGQFVDWPDQLSFDSPPHWWEGLFYAWEVVLRREGLGKQLYQCWARGG